MSEYAHIENCIRGGTCICLCDKCCAKGKREFIYHVWIERDGVSTQLVHFISTIDQVEAVQCALNLRGIITRNEIVKNFREVPRRKIEIKY